MTEGSENVPTSRAREQTPEPWFKFLGLIIVRKADLLAAAAFLLAISSVAYQLWEIARGAQVTLYHPDIVYIYFDKYPDNTYVTRFAGEVSLTNGGAIGRDAIVRSISIRVQARKNYALPQGFWSRFIYSKFGSRFFATNREISDDTSFIEEWTSFVKASREGTELSLDPVETAHPLPIAGSSALSRMMTFAPSPVDCHRVIHGDTESIPRCNINENYVSDVEFFNRISQAEQLDIEFSASVLTTHKVLASSCRILLTRRLKTVLAYNNWFPARCFPSND